MDVTDRRAPAPRPVLLFRVSSQAADEFAAAVAACHADGVAVCVCRSAAGGGSVVFGRYSVLPFYDELAADLALGGSRLVNAPAEHRWIASMAYARDLARHTFPTWTEDAFPRTSDPGPFVVKGATNSRKHHWDTMMYAADRRAAVEVMVRLRQDSLIGTQPLVVRKYVPLVVREVGLNGLRFADEYRFFFVGTTPIAAGYYWSEADLAAPPPVPATAASFAAAVAAEVAEHATFFVLDVARTEAGPWILVEVNDGAMSGLSTIDPAVFYTNLAAAMRAYARAAPAPS